MLFNRKRGGGLNNPAAASDVCSSSTESVGSSTSSQRRRRRYSKDLFTPHKIASLIFLFLGWVAFEMSHLRPSPHYAFYIIIGAISLGGIFLLTVFKWETVRVTTTAAGGAPASTRQDAKPLPTSATSPKTVAKKKEPALMAEARLPDENDDDGPLAHSNTLYSDNNMLLQEQQQRCQTNFHHPTPIEKHHYHYQAPCNKSPRFGAYKYEGNANNNFDQYKGQYHHQNHFDQDINNRDQAPLLGPRFDCLSHLPYECTERKAEHQILETPTSASIYNYDAKSNAASVPLAFYAQGWQEFYQHPNAPPTGGVSSSSTADASLMPSKPPLAGGGPPAYMRSSSIPDGPSFNSGQHFLCSQDPSVGPLAQKNDGLGVPETAAAAAGRLNSHSTANVPDRLSLNDFYVFHVPINELVRYFSAPENQEALPMFCNKVLENIDVISASVAADLMRLPVKVNYHNPEFIHGLCSRILQFPAQVRNLTSMQIALVCWSLAKTFQNNTGKPDHLGFTYTLVLNSMAEETLLKIREFQPLSIANLLWACGKMRYKHEKLINELSDAAAVQLDAFNAQNIANTYWALGTLEVGLTPLTPRLPTSIPMENTTIVKTLVQKFSTFNSQAIANFIWACARLQWNVPILLHEGCQAAVQNLRNFKPQEIANFMWGIAKLGYMDGAPTMEAFAQRAATNLTLFNSQEVSNAYWALGTLELRGTALTPSEVSVPIGFTLATPRQNGDSGESTATSSTVLPSGSPSSTDLQQLTAPMSASISSRESLSDKQQQLQPILFAPHSKDRQPPKNQLLATLLHKVERFNSQAVSNFIWACGRLQWKSPEVFAASRLVIQRNLGYFRPQNTANILWALARLKINDTELIRLLIGSAVSCFDQFNTQEIANIYWAIGTLELRESPLTPTCYNLNSPLEKGNSICQIIKSKLPNFKPQEISNFLWACARLRWKSNILLDAAAEAALKCAGRFKPQEVGNLAWALAKLNYRHVELLTTMCNNAALNIRHFTPQNIANIYWAIGSLTFSQTLLSNDHPTEEFLDALLQLIKKFNDQELTTFLWSCGRLRWEVKEVIAAVSEIVVRKERLFRKKEVLNLQWAFKKLGYHDLVEVLDSSLEEEPTTTTAGQTVSNK